MKSILNLLTVGRSKGGALICSTQDLGRIEEAYGKSNTKTFFNNFGTNIFFRIKEPETAKFLSDALGEKEIITRMESRQMSPSEIGDRKSISDQEKMKKLILPTEFQELPDLHAIISISNFGVSKLRVPAIFYQERYPNFVPRELDESVFIDDNFGDGFESERRSN